MLNLTIAPIQVPFVNVRGIEEVEEVKGEQGAEEAGGLEGEGREVGIERREESSLASSSDAFNHPWWRRERGKWLVWE